MAHLTDNQVEFVMLKAGSHGRNCHVKDKTIITTSDLRKIAEEFVPVPVTKDGVEVGRVIRARVEGYKLIGVIEFDKETTCDTLTAAAKK